MDGKECDLLTLYPKANLRHFIYLSEVIRLWAIFSTNIFPFQIIVATESSSDVISVDDLRGQVSEDQKKCSFNWHHFKLTLTREVLQVEIDNNPPFVVNNNQPYPLLYGTVLVGGSNRGMRNFYSSERKKTYNFLSHSANIQRFSKNLLSQFY